jgi:predicted nucleic acid-binding protein
VRIFVDSSVLFAAALSPKGSARDLIEAGLCQNVMLFMSNFVLAETRRNLAAKAPRGLAGLEEFLAAGLLEFIDPDRTSVIEIARNIEPKDAAIIAGALSANATVLATYDRKHLLAHADEISVRYGLVVVTPDKAMNLFND